MLVEPPVLDGDDGALQVGRDAADGNVIRTVDAGLDGTTHKEDACDPLRGFGLSHIVQPVCGLLRFRIGKQHTDALPRVREEQECSGARRQSDEYKDHE